MGIRRYAPKPGQINLLPRPIGVELEYSEIQLFKPALNRVVNFAHWEHDGTLTRGGEELVVSPASGDQLMQYLTTLIGLHENFPPAVDASCGFHVHVQSGDFSMVELRRLIAAWCKVEGEVFGSLVKAERRKGREDGHHYCRPMAICEAERAEAWQFAPVDVVKLMRKRLLEVNSHSTSTPEERIKAALMKKLYGIEWKIEPPPAEVKRPLPEDVNYNKKFTQWVNYRKKVDAIERAKSTFERIKAYKRTQNAHGDSGGCRYAAMNVHSHFFRGTIEFRLKEGTIEAEEVIFWPLFCGWFVEAAKRLSDSEVMGLEGLRGWVEVMKEKAWVQPAVVEWVEDKLKS